MSRPVVYVLAGVNGAGKSSIGGAHLHRAGSTWFNPDTFAREFRRAGSCGAAEANAAAWQEGMRRLDAALAQGESFAFETTLGGRSVPVKLLRAAQTHDVILWFCGLASVELHVARVAARVARGGHAIAEPKIRERWIASRANLVALLPHVAMAVVYDNSAEAGADGVVPDPVKVLEVVKGEILYPVHVREFARTPEWAKPIVAAASELGEGG